MALGGGHKWGRGGNAHLTGKSGELGAVQQSFLRKCRGTGPFTRECGQAYPNCQKTLCKSMLYRKHVCPCALEKEWGSKISKLRTPQKCRILRCQGETAEGSAGYTSPGTSAKLS